jgi:hypothetical protein
MEAVYHHSHIFELISMRLDAKSLGRLSQVSRDVCGRVRMKYYYNYPYCVPPMGASWWMLSDDTGMLATLTA